MPNSDHKRYNSDQFSERLKAIVGDRSYRQFAKLIGIKDATLHSWIQGKTAPGMTNLIAICKVGKCRLEWLVFGEGPMRAGTNEEPARYTVEQREKIRAEELEDMLDTLLEINEWLDNYLDTNDLEIRPEIRRKFLETAYNFFTDKGEQPKTAIEKIFDALSTVIKGSR